MSRLALSLAISDYEHVRDLVEGRVRPEGIDLLCQRFAVEEIFYRFIRHREWDVSELSFAKYLAIAAGEDGDLSALPVFPSRTFRQSSLYVRADSDLTRPEQLAGRRVGVPEWAQTAAVYTRGWLMHQVGVPLAAIDWVQAGVNEPGRAEKVPLTLPAGVRLTRVADRSLDAMLLDGSIDAVASAHPPAAYEDGSGRLRPLLSDAEAVERDYYASTGIFPIMHVIAVRRAVLDRHPWIAVNLYEAFDAARVAALARLQERTASRVPLPWAAARYRQDLALFGGDPFVYGIEANRRTLEAFVDYAVEQGVAPRRVAVEALFAPQLAGRFRI